MTIKEESTRVYELLAKDLRKGDLLVGMDGKQWEFVRHGYVGTGVTLILANADGLEFDLRASDLSRVFTVIRRADAF